METGKILPTFRFEGKEKKKNANHGETLKGLS